MSMDGCTKGSDVEVRGVRIHVCTDAHGSKTYLSHRVYCNPELAASGERDFGTCTRCRTPVMLSPAGADVVARWKLEVLCCICHPAIDVKKSGRDHLIMTKAQFEEVCASNIDPGDYGRAG